MSIYLDNGYVDIGRIMGGHYPFIFCWGGRGTGKTYGALKYCIDNKIKFMYMRRLQSQCDMINKSTFNPIIPVVADMGLKVEVKSIVRGCAGIYLKDSEDDTDDTKMAGFTAALSTIANLRGFAAVDLVDIIIYDEFIPEPHEKPLKNECEALLNCYETVNRNRELSGHEPVKLICLANSNMLTNPIFEGLKLTKRVQLMRKKHLEVMNDDKRGICLYALDNSPISIRKRDTALYRMIGNSKFSKMALENDYNSDTGSTIATQDLKEYKPLLAIGKLCIYAHKKDDKLYCTTHISGSPAKYGDSKIEINRMLQNYDWIWSKNLKNKIIFESESCENRFTQIFTGCG